MADGLNLATLNVAVQATGVQETQRDINNLTSSVQQSGSTTQQSTSGMLGAFNGLGDSVRGAFNNTQIFGTSLGDLRTQLSSGQGATALLQGAVTGLTTALINMAVQGLSRVISGLKDFVGRGVELASDLTEIQNVLDAAFGDSASEVNEWSTTVAKAYGLTEIQAKQYSSTLGAILSGMSITGDQALTMSTQMAQLTGDMASFYNLDHEVAFSKIKSGLTGETEPLKALGIVMTETNLAAFALASGMEKTYSQMSASEKTILRYNYLIEQTSLAHGDFAKTQDSYANVSASMDNNMSALSATLGTQLLPVLTNFKVMFNDVLKVMSPIVEMIGKLVGGMLTTLMNMISPFVELIKLVISALNPVINIINKILDVVLDVVGAIGTGLTQVITWFGEKMGLVQDKTAETAKYTTEEIKEQTDEALGYVTTATQKWIDEQMDAYESKLRERYGDSGSLANEIKIQELLERRETSLQKTADITTKMYEQGEQSKQKAIEQTTQVLQKQQKEQEKAQSETLKFTDFLKAYLQTFASLTIPGTYGLSQTLGGLKKSITGSYATGTAYHPGGLAMVGENGRELINLPRGAQVATNRQTENMMAGAGNTGQVINNYYATIDASTVKDFVDVSSAFSSYTQNSRMG